MPDEEHGSFSLGFTFGLLAGVAGFFVFGTERGKYARRQFSKQWQEAQTALAKHPDSPLLTLREACKHVLSAVLENSSSTATVVVKTPNKRKKTQESREKKQKFAGI
ncbi:MAG: hypothetical protein A2632_02305 [Candidatus Pacebacteria bacterium RIFCSPHIGHO2_01_FULL_46_16]|nr:MAG: hypothetical protein A2632_02305 [Candidatus Pacebacteria bacterium RIFCSPHIGHO2_01_FULL_46_16]OGJ22269.1 MAG: hypothetical protein A3J60_04100 [Candidatus Pacebacteria bacterium RIFCSPHIGHO2_02_FULL_46_9]OGJ38218.1 MAG: hypothetical protein A3A82_01265 [Candidatus Pacebacteria bacterium RIFCSPLOWO2_01_FULL_47_12]